MEEVWPNVPISVNCCNVCSVLFYALCRSVTQLNCFSKAVSQSYNVPGYDVMVWLISLDGKLDCLGGKGKLPPFPPSR